MYDLGNRLGAGSVKQDNGTFINIELRNCPLFESFKWHRIGLKVEPVSLLPVRSLSTLLTRRPDPKAPFLPDPPPDPSREIHKRPLPKQRKLPEIRVKRPPPLLEYDEFRTEAERARKRRYVVEEEAVDDRQTASTIRARSPEV